MNNKRQHVIAALACMLMLQFAHAQTNRPGKVQGANVKPTQVLEVNKAKPDLIIKGMTMQVDNKTIDILVENTGDGSAASFLLELECIKNYMPAKDCKTVQNVVAIGAHKSRLVKITISNGQDAQGYQATVNADGKISESNSNNNKSAVAKLAYGPLTMATVGELPDLVPLLISPPHIKDGKNIMEVRILNRGGTASSGFYVNFYWMKNNGGKEMGASFVKSVNAGAETWVILELPMAAPNPNPGYQNPFLPVKSDIGFDIISTTQNLSNPTNYMITLDTQDTVKESDEKNNVLFYSFIGGSYKK